MWTSFHYTMSMLYPKRGSGPGSLSVVWAFLEWLFIPCSSDQMNKPGLIIIQKEKVKKFLAIFFIDYFGVIALVLIEINCIDNLIMPHVLNFSNY